MSHTFAAREERAVTDHAEGTIEITNWDEQPLVTIDDDRKVTTTTVAQRFQGDVEGEGSATWLSVYFADGTAEYVGFQRIEGTVGGRAGSIVLRMTGGYDGSVARSRWEAVPGAGTGGLATLRGTGTSDATSTAPPPYSLDYEV
jgi:hypothetical protein